ncbi:MAG TPA: hypothetical protein VID94_05245 [Acidimicrobiales bacterium]
MAARSPKAMPLADAAALTSTGDLWLFQGMSAADRAIRLFTNSPVNHVAVALTIEDLPPLLWHAELGMSTEDVWAGQPQRGAQLHRLTEAVTTWVDKYGQRPYFRQLDTVVTRDMEDEFLRVVNEWNGHRFPRTGSLVRRWLSGRIRRSVPLEDVFCAELAAITYQRMGLLGSERPVNWYDPGRFWSGDRLELSPGAVLGEEIEVLV